MLVMNQGYYQYQHQDQSCKLTQKQLQIQLFDDFIITPHANCTNCNHHLNNDEIIAGFSENPIDFTTKCSKCGTRFLSSLIINFVNKEAKVEKVTYMCLNQTLHAMKTLKQKRGRLGIKYLAKNDRQLFYNIIKHFGRYANAIAALKIA